jgi:hypothetical protein
VGQTRISKTISRLKGRAPGYDARAPYRDAIANVTNARIIELEPDAGALMRKLEVTRTAKEVNREMGYGESDTGTLLVWLERPKQRRGTWKRKAIDADDE